MLQLETTNKKEKIKKEQAYLCLTSRRCYLTNQNSDHVGRINLMLYIGARLFVLLLVPGMHPVPGGEYPLPAPAVALVKLMPPPHCFHGPFVKIDDLMDKFADCPLPSGKILFLC